MASVSTIVDIVLPVIQRLRIEPGEVLVIKGVRFVRESHRDEFRKQVQELLPGVKVMLLPVEAELAVIAPVRAPEVIPGVRFDMPPNEAAAYRASWAASMLECQASNPAPIWSITSTTVDGKEETCQPTEHERMAEFFKRESSNGK